MTLKIIANKYEILAELGRGGMGRVYKVRHRELNKIYALKLLREHLVEDDNQVARFHSEARIMANLRQDHIVQVFDIDRAGDQHFFVMEYIEGKTLADLIKEQA
ncbi:MAG: protein kinase, partial [Candidatus Competibacteraceae bacterium]|nr:protein kinase [Candidatus Competibacteraceae bacterium]